MSDVHSNEIRTGPSRILIDFLLQQENLSRFGDIKFLMFHIIWELINKQMKKKSLNVLQEPKISQAEKRGSAYGIPLNWLNSFKTD